MFSVSDIWKRYVLERVHQASHTDMSHAPLAWKMPAHVMQRWSRAPALALPRTSATSGHPGQQLMRCPGRGPDDRLWLRGCSKSPGLAALRRHRRGRSVEPHSAITGLLEGLLPWRVPPSLPGLGRVLMKHKLEDCIYYLSKNGDWKRLTIVAMLCAGPVLSPERRWKSCLQATTSTNRPSGPRTWTTRLITRLREAGCKWQECEYYRYDVCLIDVVPMSDMPSNARHLLGFRGLGQGFRGVV